MEEGSFSGRRGGGGGGIGAEAAQILAFRQDSRGPASPLFPFPPAFIELLAPSLNSYRAPHVRETEEARPVSFLSRASSRARPPWVRRAAVPSSACIFERNGRIIGRTFLFNRFLARACLQRNEIFPFRGASPLSHAPLCALHILSPRLINRASLPFEPPPLACFPPPPPPTRVRI